MNDDLTIFLPLRGRHLHTLRWLWHADRTGLPFRVIVADGDVHPAIERLLFDPGTFPNLRLDYHRYADRSFSDFYRKCAESLDRVATPYVVLADNDDFMLPSGIEKNIAFLDANPDFVCALGGIPGFDTADRADAWNRVLGPVGKWRYRCHNDGSYDPRNIDQPAAADRVLAELRHFLSVYYGVYRTVALRTVMREIQELDFSDLLMHEFFFALRALTLGKVAATGTHLAYLRQGNSSSRFSFDTDWVAHLLRSRFPQDFQALARRIAHHALPADDRETEVLENRIHDEFAVYLRRMLAGTLLGGRFPRLYAAKQRLLGLRRAVALPERWRVALQERDFWRRLAADGASDETIARHRGEMADIRRTLSGGEFVDFVQRNAPELLGG